MQLKNILTIYIVIISCLYQKNDTNKLRLTIHVDSRQTVNNVTYLIVKATLKNISSDTFTYVVESCFYPFAYTTDSKIFAIVQTDCIKNITKFIEIPPGKSLKTIIRLPMNKDIGESPRSHFKICAHLISSNNVINALHKKGNLIMVSSKDHKVQLCDTSYAVQVEGTTMDENGSIVRFEAKTSKENVWSNIVSFK